MFENLEDTAYGYLKEFKKISPCLLMRRLKLNYDTALKVCEKVWLRQHLEARKLAKELEKS